MQEFQLIYRYFAPLAGEGAAQLRDDAALLIPPYGRELVLTQDAMTAGVHFFPDDPAELIARKLLRANLSDLAAKGARPLGYLLSLLLPEGVTEEWVAAFASGLEHDQQEFGIKLLGGDTSRITGPLTFSLTAIGSVTAGRMLRRSGAKPGDAVYMSGTLGDAALGLLIRQGKLPADMFLEDRYMLPQPRMELGIALRGIATAAMDVSDGLMQDAGHLAAASGVEIQLEAARLPLSAPARKLLAVQPELLETIVSGGDDYEILFTAPPGVAVGLAATRIGTVAAGSGVKLYDAAGKEIVLQRKGWSHF